MTTPPRLLHFSRSFFAAAADQRSEREGIDFLQVSDTERLDNQFGTDKLPSPRPRTFRWSGPDTFRDSDYYNGLLEVEHRLRDNLTLIVAGNFSRSAFDFMEVDNFPYPVIVANKGPAEFWQPWRLGPNRSLEYRWALKTEARPTQQLRAELSWQFDLFRARHNVLLGRADARRELSTSDALTDLNYRSLLDYDYFRFSENQNSRFLANSAQDQVAWDQGTYLAYQGKFFGGRLQTVSGVRYDRADVLSRIRRYNRNYAAGEAPLTTDLTSRRPNNEPTTKFSPQVGLNYAITRELSLYALASRGLNPNYFQTDGNGNPFAPVQSQSREVGLKFDLFNGKLSGTVSAFKIERKNTTRLLSFAPAPVRKLFDPTRPITYVLPRNINGARPHPTTGQLVTPEQFFPWYVRGTGTYTFTVGNPEDEAKLEDWLLGPWTDFVASGIYNVAGNNPSQDRGTQVPLDDASEGVDLQLIWQPNDRWQFIATYAYVDREITNGATLVRHPHETKWDIWYSPFRFARENFGTVGDASTYFGTFGKGYRLDDTPYNQASLWSKYTFTAGRLRGLDLGLGAKWSGPREYIGASNSTGGVAAFNSLGQQVARIVTTTSEEFTFDTSIGYKRRLGGRDWRFQFNVYNVADIQKKIGNTYKDPRTMRFSTQVTF